MSNLRSINLNLLPVLRELLRTKNVTNAAESLNMRQSTVSETLGRIRHILGDEILVPKGRRLVLTAYAERLQERLEETLSHLEELLLPPALSLEHLNGCIVVALADYVVWAIGPKLLRQIAISAPKLTVHFVNVSFGSISELRQGQIDLLVVPAGVTGATTDMDGFDSMHLFEEEIICLSADNSRYQDKISRTEWETARHISFCSDRSATSSYESVVLGQIGLTRVDAARVSSFMLLPFLIENTDYLCLVTKIIGGVFKQNLQHKSCRIAIFFAAKSLLRLLA